MKIITGAAIAAAAITLTITSPMAADLPPAPEPIPVAAPDWTGFYVGGHAGYAWGKAKNGLTCEGISAWVFVYEPGAPATGNCEDGALAGGSLESNDHPFGIYYLNDDDPEGWLAGLQVGYNYQMGNFVIGAEVSGSAGSVSADRIGVIEAQICCPGFTGRYDVNWLVTAVGKIGWAWDNILLSAEGGLALVNTSNSNTLGFSDDGVTDAGWTVGGSAEWMFTDSLSLFAKYNYIQVDGVEHLGANWILFPTLYESDLEMHVVKVGFNKTFR